MKKFTVCVALCLCLVMSSFAQTVDNLPTWIKNSRIIHSELAFGSSKTIGDLYGKKPQDMAITTVKYSDTECIITNMVGTEEFYLLKMEVTYEMDKNGDSGTCWPSYILVESPLAGQKIQHFCYDPYKDIENYGQIMGMISSGLDNFYE